MIIKKKTFLKFPTFEDNRGKLTVIERAIPFQIERIYYIYKTNQLDRGYHSHIKTSQVALVLAGSCKITFSEGNIKKDYTLKKPDEGLLILPGEFHWMSDFSDDCVLMVIASHGYDKSDYVY
tara:strand:- start:737 stop:1102 length:366 start_codon:yes stop_codon:yes gene_type:complete